MTWARRPDRILAAFGLIVASALGFGALANGTYVLWDCFSTPDLSGCTSRTVGFSLETAPALWPLVLLTLALLLTAAAVVAIRSRALTSAAVVLHAAIVAEIALNGDPPVLLATPPLAAAALVRIGLPPRRSALDVAAAAGLVALAFVIGFATLVAIVFVRGRVVTAWLPLLWMYVAYTGVAGIGLGLALAQRGQRSFPLSLGLVAAYGPAGLAGALAALVTPPEGGKAAIFPVGPVLLGCAIAFGAATARRLFALRAREAIALAAAIALAFGPWVLLVFATGVGYGGTAMTLGHELLRLPMLPGTSTLP